MLKLESPSVKCQVPNEARETNDGAKKEEKRRKKAPRNKP